ncbi:hypothetical protein EMIT0111MI5_10236 [Burkholderia sp. IT-111MI5]
MRARGRCRDRRRPTRGRYGLAAALIRPARFNEAQDDPVSVCRQAGVRFRYRRRIQPNETALSQAVKIGRVARSARRLARENHHDRDFMGAQQPVCIRIGRPFAMRRDRSRGGNDRVIGRVLESRGHDVIRIVNVKTQTGRNRVDVDLDRHAQRSMFALVGQSFLMQVSNRSKVIGMHPNSRRSAFART